MRRWLIALIAEALAPTLFAVEAKQAILSEDFATHQIFSDKTRELVLDLGVKVSYINDQSRIGRVDSQLERILGELKELNARLKTLELELADKRRLSRAKLPDFEQAEALALAGMEVTE